MSILILYVAVTQDICLWNLGQKNLPYVTNSSADVFFVSDLRLSQKDASYSCRAVRVF